MSLFFCPSRHHKKQRQSAGGLERRDQTVKIGSDTTRFSGTRKVALEPQYVCKDVRWDGLEWTVTQLERTGLCWVKGNVGVHPCDNRRLERCKEGVPLLER